jgi:hypothetical protein
LTITASWIDPSAAGLLDIANGTVVTQTHWDYIVSDLLFLGGSTGKVTSAQFASSSGVFSTTSTTPALMTSPTVTLTTSGTGPVIVAAGVVVANTALGAWNVLYLAQDGGVAGPFALVQTPVANQMVQLVAVNLYPSPVAGSHVYQPAWAVNTGTASTSNGTNNWIVAMELRR